MEPLTPPEGAAVGERVWFGEEAEQGEPAKPNQVRLRCWLNTQCCAWRLRLIVCCAACLVQAVMPIGAAAVE